MTATITAIFEQDGTWWIGYVAKLPDANMQGATLDEARENLKEAVELSVGANRELAQGMKQAAHRDAGRCLSCV